QVGERRSTLEHERERADVAAREAAAERDLREAEVAEIAEDHRRQLDVRQSIEAELGEAQRGLNGLVGRLHELDLKETEERVRREELFQEARRRHAIESVEALIAALDPSGDVSELRTRHQELCTKLESMGPVNLVADE